MIRAVYENDLLSSGQWVLRTIGKSLLLLLGLFILAIKLEPNILRLLLDVVILAAFLRGIVRDCYHTPSFKTIIFLGFYYGLFVFLIFFLIGNVQISIVKVSVPTYFGFFIFPLVTGLLFLLGWYITISVYGSLEVISQDQCKSCGYDLRGQSEPRCPECGTEFDPKLIEKNRDDKEPEAAS